MVGGIIIEKLKTLKDLEEICDSVKEELRQEAIKWIKHLRAEPFVGENDFYWHSKFHTNLEEWIKHFFNITEEDLK